MRGWRWWTATIRFEERNDYVEDLFRNGLMWDELDSGMDWVVANTAAEELPEVTRRMVRAMTSRSNESGPAWVERQEPGSIRDAGHAGVVDWMIGVSRFPEALAEVDNINDATLRTETLRSVGRRWLERDRESAEQELPAELLQQLQNQ